ncbi:MAG TPA: GatB/YqeY domain-containing protein [Candidatus Sulfotelmatobacter sp.]|nr:GatB/YqeY domain-containing protein [Candidatus Sulfotelmatobacter sp.]
MDKQKLQEEIKQSMFAKDELKTSVLRMLLSAITKYEMDIVLKEYEEKLKEVGEENENDIKVSKNYIASEKEIEAVMQNQAKQRRDSIEQFSKAGRQDLVDKEQKELEILNAYLPVQMSEEEITKLVKDAIAKTGASTMADIGKVMGTLMPSVKGKADGNLVNTIVRKHLTS